MTDEALVRSCAEKLIDWCRDARRPLPWRLSPTPYHVWISEIMLQQTRIEAVIPYYTRFLEALPDVRALAEVEEDKLLKLWEGLGYYSRARNLRKAARQIMEDCGGVQTNSKSSPASATIPPGPLPPSPTESRSPRWTGMSCG